MLGKLKEYHKKLDQKQEQIQPSQDNYKHLLQERKRERLLQQNLPKYAQKIDDQIICTMCQSVYKDVINFKLHINQTLHLEALRLLKQELEIKQQEIEKEQEQKRAAQVSINVLQSEIENIQSQEIQEVKRKRLTKAQIERINQEVELEYLSQNQQIEPIQEKTFQLPDGFFEEPPQEEESPEYEIEENEDDDNLQLEEVLNVLDEVKEKLEKSQKKIKPSRFDYLDQIINEEYNESDALEVEWKKKNF